MKVGAKNDIIYVKVFSYSFRYSILEMNKFMAIKIAVIVLRSKVDGNENKYIFIDFKKFEYYQNHLDTEGNFKQKDTCAKL